jgi:hypothetical protein
MTSKQVLQLPHSIYARNKSACHVLKALTTGAPLHSFNFCALATVLAGPTGSRVAYPGGKGGLSTNEFLVCRMPATAALCPHPPHPNPHRPGLPCPSWSKRSLHPPSTLTNSSFTKYQAFPVAGLCTITTSPATTKSVGTAAASCKHWSARQ